MADHLPSTRRPPAAPPPGKVVVLNGRCTLGGERAPQKCCWVLLREPMTPQQYRERFAAKTIPLEPCPCCGGRLRPWGSFARRLAEADPPLLQELLLLRGLCANPDCPVRTVTHYPCFVTPYETVPSGERERAVRLRAEEGLSWSALAKRVPWGVVMVRAWEAEIAARAAEILTGLLAVWQRLDAQAPAEVAVATGRHGLLRAMFGVCDAVRDLLRRREGWTAPVPGLAVPRMFRPRPPTPLPVWT